MDRAYVYWLVRYVPDVARDERVNVAVIVGRDGGDWSIRVAPDLRRASRLGGDASVLRPWLQLLRRTIERYQHPPLDMFAPGDEIIVSQAWLELLSHRYNNVLQLSDAAPVMAASAAAGADFLFRHLIATSLPVPRTQTRQQILNTLKVHYLQTASLTLGQSLLRSPRLFTGLQRGRFDFAVVHEGVGQLSQVFAFDMRDAEVLERNVQSWNFLVGRIRQDGAELSLRDVQHRLVSATVQIAVAYQEPEETSGPHGEIFDAARESWERLDIHAVPSSQLDRIVHNARELVAA